MNNAQNGSASAGDLLKKLQELAFMKVETELYLDSHPECMQAMEHYKKIISDYERVLEEYENTVAPVTQSSAVGERWRWVDTPWPWQLGGNGREK